MHLIYFYRDDCPPCAQRKPAAEQVADETGLPMAYVDANAKDAVFAVWPPNATAPSHVHNVGEVLDRYQVKIVPTLVLVRDDGTRAATWAGGMIMAATVIPTVRRHLGVTAR